MHSLQSLQVYNKKEPPPSIVRGCAVMCGCTVICGCTVMRGCAVMRGRTVTCGCAMMSLDAQSMHARAHHLNPNSPICPTARFQLVTAIFCAERVAAIWETYHSDKPAVSGASLNESEHQLILDRGAESPLFVFPVWRESEPGKKGHFMLLSQVTPHTPTLPNPLYPTHSSQPILHHPLYPNPTPPRDVATREKEWDT